MITAMHVHKYKIKQNQKGIGLVEVIAALGISVIVITSLVSLSLTTLRSSLQSKLLLEATKIANKEVEALRSYRDRSLTWDQFIIDITPCIAAQCNMTDLNTVTTGAGTINSNGQTLTKSFTLTQETEDLIKVEVEVLWSVGPQAKNTHIYTYLSNWQNK